MKTSCISVALLAVMLGGAAAANAATAEQSGGQARIAETTLKLESAFSEQFAKGQIDRAALAPLVNDVVQAMPEGARPRVQAHIEQVLQGGEKLAPAWTPQERAQAVAVPDRDTMTPLQIGLGTSWGWPGAVGWGGLGAFGFPGMWGGGLGCGFGACGAGLGTTGWFW
jgi:hypothetical protein